MRGQSRMVLLFFLWLSIFLIIGAQPVQRHDAAEAEVVGETGDEGEKSYDTGIDRTAEFDPYGIGAILDLDLSAKLQRRPDVAWNQSCNKFLAVYDRKRTDVDYDIWGRYISGSGLVLGAGPFRLTTDGLKQQVPAIAYNDAGDNYLVVWQDNRDGNWEIYAQLWNCQKTNVNDALNLTNNASHQLAPDVICGYSAGEPVCWVVWEDFRDGNWNIYGQRLDGGGAVIGGNVQLTTNTRIQRAPAIARNPENTGCNPDGTFLVVWHDNRNAGKGYGYDIYGQQLDNIGLCGLNMPIYAGLGDQLYPDIAYGTANDHYQVVWQDNRAGNWDVYARRVLPSGSGDGLSFALGVAPNTQSRPAVAYDMNTNNQFLTVWEDLQAGTYDINSQRTSGLGALLGGWMISATPDAETNPAVAFGSTADHYFVVWEDSTDGIQGRALWP